MGVVCANYGRTRGTSKVCRSVWHAGCYRQDDRDRFPILEAGDLDDALLDTEGHGELEDDENRFKEARDGDHLMCPFQCDSCTFYNLKGRYAREDSEQDMLLAVCIRRAILDSFWSRERSTVEKNTREMKNLRNLGESIGLDEPLPERGPFPIGDTQGVGIASLMLMKTLSVGRNAKHIQYETARKVRSVVSNFAHTLPGYTGLSTMGGSDRSSMMFTASPTNSLWFKRFMAGCHRRMGDVWIPDRAVTLDEVHCGLEILEGEWKKSPQGQRRLELALTGALVVIGFCAALRGEEIPQVDVGLLRKYWMEGINYTPAPHIPLALAGRFKQTDGTFRLYIQPLAIKTGSGIEIRVWIGRAIKELELRKVTSGPMFRQTDKTGKTRRALVGDLDHLFHGLWKRIQHRRPDLMADNIKVDEVYSARRSFRRGATTTAQNRKIKTEVIEMNNRWRKHIRSRGVLPGMTMLERYSDAKTAVEALIQFSAGM